MSDPEPLPVLVVSAADVATADQLVQLVLGAEAVAGVWKVATKYYTARVALRLRAHDEPLTAAADAHLVHLSEQDVHSPEVLTARVQAVTVLSDGPLLCACGALPDERLRAAALALRCQLVPMLPADDDDDWGVPVIRDALHAHLWHNLQTCHTVHEAENTLEPSSESTSENEEEDIELALQRCEQFAQVLGAVRGVRGAGQGEQWGEEREQRLRRAEDLVLAFTRALT